MTKTECNNLYVFNFRKMARSLNSHCDFKEGFFTCDLPVDMVELVSEGENKMWQTYFERKEDWEKRVEKYRPWERWTDDKEN